MLSGSWTRFLSVTRLPDLGSHDSFTAQPVAASSPLHYLSRQGTRVREGIRSFIENTKKLGKSEKTAHSLYVQGMDQNGAKVSTKEHLKRGAALSALTDMWLYTWGEAESA